MSLSPIQLHSVARLGQFLQDYELINRGVLDTLGAAVPVLALTRTPQERREKILDRTVVIGSAFFLAPIHASLFRHVVAKQAKVPTEGLALSYANLKSTVGLKQAIAQQQKILTLPKQWLRLNSRQLENLRQRLVKGKVNMLVPDLILECLLMGGVGWITNLYSQWQTGKNRFAGELNATSKENLERLYQKEAKYQRSEKIRLGASLAMAVGMPLTIGFLLKRAFLPKRFTGNAVAKLLRDKPRWFDYKNGRWMSMPALGIVVTSQFMGHLFAARNKRELRENAIRETMMNAIFFWGNDAWMKLLSKGRQAMMKTGGSETQVSKILASTKLKPVLKRRLGNATGSLYIASILLNSATLAAAIVINNRLTQKKVESDVQKLHKTNA